MAATAWFNLAMIYEREGNAEASARCLEAAHFQAQQGGGAELLSAIQQKLDLNNLDSITTLDAFVANLEERVQARLAVVGIDEDDVATGLRVCQREVGRDDALGVGLARAGHEQRPCVATGEADASKQPAVGLRCIAERVAQHDTQLIAPALNPEPTP